MKQSIAFSNGRSMRRLRTARFPLASLALLLVFLMQTGCKATGQQSRAGDDAYSRIMQTGRIRVGYISYPPSFIKDPNTGAYSGIFNEVLQQAAASLELKVDYTEELGWATMVEAVSSGRVDLVCTGIWPTAGRARRAEFTAPIYFSSIRAYSRKDDNRFDGNLTLANRSGIRIATIDGEMTSIIARSDFPSATGSSLPQNTDISQVLLEVTTGKADMTFVEVAVAEAFLEKNPHSVRAVANVQPVRVFPNVLMVGKGQFRLLSMLNVAIDELANNGLIDRAIAKYEKSAGLFQRRAQPYR